jgi:hypothetical protein
MLNKLIPFLIITVLIGGLLILLRGFLVMDINNPSGDSLSITGAIIFSSALISLVIYSNRWKS